MAEKIVRYKASKTAYLGHVTRAKTKLEESLLEEHIQIEEIEQLLEKLQLKYDKVEEVSRKIQDESNNVEEIEEEVNQMDALSDQIIEAKSKVKTAINRMNELKKKSEKEKENHKGKERNKESVQLPKIEIEKFAGDVEKFREFMDSFQVTIHRNRSLEDIEKFIYLKSYLTGDAKDLLEGLARTDANYSLAMEILEENYGNKEVLINNHVSKLINLDKQKENDITSLRVLYNKVTRHVRELETLGITPNMYSIFLVPIVESKISETLRKSWKKRKEKGIKKLLEFIHEEVECIESSSFVEQAFTSGDTRNQKSGTDHRGAQRIDPKYNTYQPVPSAFAFNSQTRKKYCIFCPGSENHYPDECNQTSKMSVEDRKNIIMKEEACWCCLKKGHRINDCRQRRWLKCKICGATNHNTLIHEEKIISNNSEANGYITACEAHSNSQSGNTVMLPQAKGRITGPNGEMEVNILLDICSDKNFIRKEISNRIGLQGHTEAFSINGIAGKTDEAKPRRIVTATVKNRHHLEKFQNVELVEIPEICTPFKRAAVKENILQSKYLRHLHMADDYSKDKYSTIDVLIGLPSYWSLVSGRIKRSQNCPVAMETVFGWVLVSDSTDERKQDCTSVLSMFINTNEAKEINDQLKRFWEIENMEQNTKCTGWNEEEHNVYSKFLETIKYKENEKRYEVALPLKENPVNTNKDFALRRYSSMKGRFRRNKCFEAQYKEAMKEYIDGEYAEQVKQSEETQNCYYIPHHIVVKEDRVTTKTRLILDGSSTEDNRKSLNDILHKGPALQPKLTSVIMRFRKHKIGINADVQKMYLMISMQEEDRDKLRFFWEDEEALQKIYRSTVLPFGLRCSPFIAIATIHHHLDKYENSHPELVKRLKENMYIDDALTGAETEQEAIEFYQQSTEIMREAGMNLVKWNSNSKNLIEHCKQDEVLSPLVEKSIKEDCSTKLLGVYWNSTTDMFHFKSDDMVKLTQTTRATKRNILKIAPKLYDPMGWISPFVVRAKILFQSLWEQGYEWDEGIAPDLEKRWKNWIQELQMVKEISIPRKYNQSNMNIKRRELHIFGDASQEAYGSVAYLKSYDEENQASIGLIYAKSKVAPVKKITLPRLELLAAEMSTKIAQYILESLQYTEVSLYLWTDSKITLYWIKRNSKQWKTFVYNRVQQILDRSDPENWRWCSGSSNPADLVSRGMKAEELKESELWWQGPSWLKESTEKYPNEALDENQPQEVLVEKRENLSICLVQKSMKTKAEEIAGKLVEPNNFSKMKNLLKTTAYVTRYIFNISHKAEERKFQPLNNEDIENAERYWIREIQKEHFKEEINALTKGRVIRNTSKLNTLSPYYDKEDELIKMKGRIQYADLNEGEKHPIILPCKSYVVKLIVEDAHRKQLHAGVRQTLVALRDRFWIIKGRALVRRIVKSCILCRKYAPIRLQVPMAPLPRDRVARADPFQVVGVDFTGPVFIVNPGGKVIKGYITLFTCATIRAVHLELVPDLTTDSFLRAFRRFVSTRGMCHTIYSDNAKTFKKAEKLLKEYDEIMNGKKFKDYLIENDVNWKYIVDRAAWWGGFYERLMKTIKNPLKKILGRSLLNFDEMQTVLKEVEAMVNSRPLTFVSDEPDDMSYLTPASFLIGRKVTSIPVKPMKGKEPAGNLSRKELNQMLMNQNKALNQLWKMWKEEYVRNLGTVPTREKESNKLKVGELVMVTDNLAPRCQWKIGIVEKVQKGRDEKIRTCWIKTGTSKTSIARPVQHVSRLEMDSMEDYKKLRI